MLSLKSAFMWPHVGVPTQGMPLKWEGGSLYPTWAQMVPDFLPYYLRCQDFGKHFFLSFLFVFFSSCPSSSVFFTVVCCK